MFLIMSNDGDVTRYDFPVVKIGSDEKVIDVYGCFFSSVCEITIILLLKLDCLGNFSKGPEDLQVPGVKQSVNRSV